MPTPPKKTPASKSAKPAVKARKAADAEPMLGSSGAATSAPVEKPISLDAITGHEQPKAILRSAIKSQRVHHAWVFAGEQGVGKFTTALAFAAELLLPPAASDEHLRIKDSLVRGAHPDLHVVTKELASISREDAVRRQKQTTIAKAVLDQFLLEPAARTRLVSAPSVAGKVFVIDEAELIDPVGQNTLLKTLEEPPEGTIIVLVTSVESRLLPTIRSRCQRVAFTGLNEAEMDRWLAAHASTLGEAVPVERQWIKRYARGSPGAALTAISHHLYTWHTAIEPMVEGVLTGRSGGLSAMGSLLGKLVEERVAELVKARPEASKDAANRLWSKRLLGFLAERFRAELGGNGGPAALHAIDLIAAAERQIEANVQYATAMENLATQVQSADATMLV